MEMLSTTKRHSVYSIHRAVVPWEASMYPNTSPCFSNLQPFPYLWVLQLCKDGFICTGYSSFLHFSLHV